MFRCVLLHSELLPVQLSLSLQGYKILSAQNPLEFLKGDLHAFSMLYKIFVILALGPSVLGVIVFEAILNGMAQFSHSNIYLPEGLDRALRFVLVTPDMHRIHHSVEVNETNSNYGCTI